MFFLESAVIDLYSVNIDDGRLVSLNKSWPFFKC